jgi:hypothetical protein
MLHQIRQERTFTSYFKKYVHLPLEVKEFHEKFRPPYRELNTHPSGKMVIYEQLLKLLTQSEQEK